MRQVHPAKEVLMRREILKESLTAGFDALDEEVGSNVENFKRRHALQPFWSLDLSSKLFFERALHVKRGGEFVFLTKSQGRNR